MLERVISLQRGGRTGWDGQTAEDIFIPYFFGSLGDERTKTHLTQMEPYFPPCGAWRVWQRRGR